jgi:hypothetical protein
MLLLAGTVLALTACEAGQTGPVDRLSYNTEPHPTGAAWTVPESANVSVDSQYNTAPTARQTGFMVPAEADAPKSSDYSTAPTSYTAMPPSGPMNGTSASALNGTSTNAVQFGSSGR